MPSPRKKGVKFNSKINIMKIQLTDSQGNKIRKGDSFKFFDESTIYKVDSLTDVEIGDLKFKSIKYYVTPKFITETVGSEVIRVKTAQK